MQMGFKIKKDWKNQQGTISRLLSRFLHAWESLEFITKGVGIGGSWDCANITKWLSQGSSVVGWWAGNVCGWVVSWICVLSLSIPWAKTWPKWKQREDGSSKTAMCWGPPGLRRYSLVISRMVWKLQAPLEIWACAFLLVVSVQVDKVDQDKRDLVKDAKKRDRVVHWVCWAGDWTLLAFLCREQECT